MSYFQCFIHVCLRYSSQITIKKWRFEKWRAYGLLKKKANSVARFALTSKNSQKKYDKKECVFFFPFVYLFESQRQKWRPSVGLKRKWHSRGLWLEQINKLKHKIRLPFCCNNICSKNLQKSQLISRYFPLCRETLVWILAPINQQRNRIGIWAMAWNIFWLESIS